MREERLVCDGCDKTIESGSGCVVIEARVAGDWAPMGVLKGCPVIAPVGSNSGAAGGTGPGANLDTVHVHDWMCVRLWADRREQMSNVYAHAVAGAEEKP